MNGVDLRLLSSEREFQNAVESWLDFHNWVFYHDRAAMKCPYCKAQIPARNRSGLPDLIATDGRTLLMAELKTMGGRVRPEQIRWAEALGGVERVVSGIFRPDQSDHLYDVISRGGMRS